MSFRTALFSRSWLVAVHATTVSASPFEGRSGQTDGVTVRW